MGTIILLVLLALVFLFVVTVLAKTVRIVPQARAGIVERFGKYKQTLPAGLNINTTTGLITGTVATGAATAGNDGDGYYTVTVTASDGTHTASTTFTWTVSSPITLPTIAPQQRRSFVSWGSTRWKPKRRRNRRPNG